MHEEPFSLRVTFFVGLFVLLSIAVSFFSEYFKKETTLVFCDVGQGDAAYIRIENKVDVLIDAGSDRKVLSCLGKYMPFYDRKIEYVFLSHPQKDHYGGFDQVLDRYKIQTFVMSYKKSDSALFNRLIQKLEQKETNVLLWYADTKISFTDISSASLIWPTQSSINSTIGKDPNYYSQIVLFKINDTKIFFTGDIPPLPQLYILKTVVPIDILKVPHHGSRNGLTKSFLDKVKPKIAIISVGKTNSYGHPSPVILDMLKKVGTTIRRTDLEGNIVFKF